jgi:hypothetical protein
VYPSVTNEEHGLTMPKGFGVGRPDLRLRDAVDRAGVCRWPRARWTRHLVSPSELSADPLHSAVSGHASAPCVGATLTSSGLRRMDGPTGENNALGCGVCGWTVTRGIAHPGGCRAGTP